MRQLRIRKNITHSVASTSPTRKLSRGRGKPTRNKYLVEVVGKNWATVIVWTVALALALPVFRCGGRTGLTFVDWIREHSVWGSPIQYVPEEDYATELEE